MLSSILEFISIVNKKIIKGKMILNLYKAQEEHSFITSRTIAYFMIASNN